MKTSTKWILGIGAGAVIVVCVCAVVGFALAAQFSGGDIAYGVRTGRLWGGDSILNFRSVPMVPGERVTGRWVGSFSPLSWIGGPLLLCCGFIFIVGLAVLAVVLITRQSSKPVLPSPAVPPEDVRASELPQPVDNEPESAVSPVTACASCGRLLEDEWSLCPYCGAPVSPEDESEAPD